MLGNEVVATRNIFGKGEVVWVPSLIGLGGRLSDYSGLVSFLSVETGSSISRLPIRFKNHHKGMLMKTLRSGNSLITVIINKSEAFAKVELLVSRGQKPVVLFADKQGDFLNASTLSIAHEETVVVKWD